MNYGLLHFLIALSTVAVMLPGTFLLNAKLIAPGDTWQILVYLAVTIISMVLSIIQLPIGLKMTFRQIAIIGSLCTVFLLASYCADEGESIYQVEGFWDGVFVWFVSLLILSACFAVISGFFYSLLKLNLRWPGDIINRLAFAVGAFFIGICVFCFVFDICPAAGICVLISITGLSGGKELAQSDETETLIDGSGRELRGRRYGDRFVEEGEGAVYRKRPDNGNWELIQ